MQEFYKKALTIAVGLLLVTALVGYLCINKTFVTLSLFPDSKSDLAWRIEQNTDAPAGGLSYVRVNDYKFSLDFDINLSNRAKYPHASVLIVFGSQPEQQEFVDLSSYDKVLFSTKCSTANMLTFALTTFDEKVTKENDPVSHRTPTTFFSCDKEWRQVEIDLTRLETPQWWFDMYKVELSQQEYKLNKVSKIAFGNTFQSPFDLETNIQITELTLFGRNWSYLYLFAALTIFAWGGFAIWLFREYTRALVRELNNKVQRDRPLVAYQQLTIQSHRDRDRSAILHFMATQYANADLTLEAMEVSIGVGRTKINDILKSELGFTFTGYLNKLRLTEAARLLSQDENANIAEIAYSVGYKNVSYFNKLFKEEYSCTPKTYKSVFDQTSATDG
ncbi:MAG TPA: AraC family transcriptional regulator [Cellvibrio sp.]|nr:AraC family transcriptional regulator [Cellvibrio sp.]